MTLLAPFDFPPRTRLLFGPGLLASLGAVTREYGDGPVLLVTDPGLRAAGHVDAALRVLQAAGFAVSLFDAVEENPSTANVAAGVEAARAAGARLLIALGGGSAMDCAKGINFILTNGGAMRDYWGHGKAAKPMLPLIAIPATAGTGSEVQSYALISDAHTHEKMACGDPKAAPRLALLDPELTLTSPPRVTALAGLDALAHAVESHVCRKANPLSRTFSIRAWGLLARAFCRVLREPDDLRARGAMLLGASFAGLAIEYSMLGAAHSCANPLTASFGVVHGAAVALMLPPVIRLNGEAAREGYAELAAELAPETPDGFDPAAGPAEALASFYEALRSAGGLPATLEEAGAKASAIPELAAGAAKQWTAQFNPVEMTPKLFEKLYRAAARGPVNP